MKDVALDSCVVAKWFVPEVDTAQAKKVMADTLSAGGKMIALDLALVEITNTIWKKHRAKKITLAEANGALADLTIAPLQCERAERLLDRAFAIAVKYDRAIYDALFVALANDLGMQGVTADEPLYNATHADYPEIILLRNWP